MAIKISVLFAIFSMKTSQYQNILSIFACSGFSLGRAFLFSGKTLFTFVSLYGDAFCFMGVCVAVSPQESHM